MRHALRPGGRVSAVVYSTPDRNEFFSIPVRIIRERAQLPPPLPGQPGPFSLGGSGVLEAAFTQAGFSDVEVRTVPSPVRLPSAAECVRFERESFGALHQMMRSLSADEQADTWARSRRSWGGSRASPASRVPARCSSGPPLADRQPRSSRLRSSAGRGGRDRASPRRRARRLPATGRRRARQVPAHRRGATPSPRGARGPPRSVPRRPATARPRSRGRVPREPPGPAPPRASRPARPCHRGAPSGRRPMRAPYGGTPAPVRRARSRRRRPPALPSRGEAPTGRPAGADRATAGFEVISCSEHERLDHAGAEPVPPTASRGSTPLMVEHGRAVATGQISLAGACGSVAARTRPALRARVTAPTSTPNDASAASSREAPRRASNIAR